MSLQHLAVIGGGPKAVALAAKNQVLAELGFRVPRITIFEKKNVSAHWDGNNGLTDGYQRLGVSAEKDVGFPYTSDLLDSRTAQQVNQRMQRFSYASFLIAKQQYAAYIDRSAPPPTHKQWSDYLCWVAEQTQDHVTWNFSKVTALKIQQDRWQLEAGSMWLEFDAVMVTGLGKHKQIFPQALPVSERVLTACDYWQQSLAIPPGHKVAIVGGGENAASVALSLVARFPELDIDMISPQITPYTRCEHYSENRFFSEPNKSNWQDLSVETRRDFIQRTDIGVISERGMQALNQAETIQFCMGRLKKICKGNGHDVVATISTGSTSYTKTYQLLILAIGFDFVNFLTDLLDQDDLQIIRQRAGLDTFTKESIEQHIDYDLSLKNLFPKLFLPTLAGLSQGPGFPNLSCLGSLSDRVHSNYLKNNVALGEGVFAHESV
jgi:mycobactin lysine-N-oxygenase